MEKEVPIHNMALPDTSETLFRLKYIQICSYGVGLSEIKNVCVLRGRLLHSELYCVLTFAYWHQY